MKNSIKPSLKRTENQDGSVSLEYLGSRFQKKSATSLFIFISVIISIYFIDIPRGGSLKGFVIAAFIFYATYRLLSKSRQVITIYPNQGISFFGNSVPFSEISRIGKKSDGRLGEVYIESNGNRVIVATSKTSIADEIEYQITKLSGISWQ